MTEPNNLRRFTADTLVCDVVAGHPQTVLVFVRRGLHCPGCYIAPFHTLADTAHEYLIPIAPFLHELNQAAAGEAV
jgi:hybrid cluster-associated redox disulfide protein